MIAPPLAIGALLGLGLIALFRDGKPTPNAATPPAKPSPAPDAKRQRPGWTFFDDEPAAPTPAPGDAMSAATPRVSPPGTIPDPGRAPVAVTDLAAASPRPSPLFPSKIDAGHLAAVLKAGPLPRPSIVKALKAAPYHYGASTAYKALNRFAHRLETAPDGALHWKGWVGRWPDGCPAAVR